MFTTEQKDHMLTVIPEVDITSTTADDFRKQLKELVDAGHANLIIDLKKVKMIDSKGLAVFIVCHQVVSAKGGSLTVVTDNADFLGLFRVMRLDQHFTVTSNATSHA